MAITMQDVRAWLDRDELDYPAAAAALGAGAVPHLKQLVQGRDPMLASKAAYLASLIRAPDALGVLELATTRGEAAVRVAAAAALRNLDPVAAKKADAVAKRLNADKDAGVRRLVVQSRAGKAAPKRTPTEQVPAKAAKNTERKLRSKAATKTRTK